MSTVPPLRVDILGAGLVGRFLAAQWASCQGLTVRLIGRTWQPAQSITATWPERAQGVHVSLAQHTLDELCQNPPELLVITVKCTAIQSLCQQLADKLDPTVPILWLQNGIQVLETVQQWLPNPALRGIVPFNIAALSDTGLEQVSAGELLLDGHCDLLQWLAAHCQQQQVPCQLVNDIRGVEAGKLLLNLNNALNALADIPLLQQLNDRRWRKLLASAMQEWLEVCNRLHIQPYRFTKISPHWLPWVLRLPNFIYKRIAGRLLKIDPKARLSMWHDLQKGQATEIAWLNGAVVQQAQQLELQAPINQWITDRIITAEKQQQRQGRQANS